MPLPKTRNVGKIIKELKTGKKRTKKERIAIALSHARKMGADIPKKKGNLNSNRIAGIVGKIKLHDAGVKRTKLEVRPFREKKINYPSLHLNVKQVPELIGHNVDDKVTLVTKGKVVSHSKDESIQEPVRETFDVEIEKIGVK